MSKDLFLNALCPSVRGDSNARRIPYLEKQLVREVLSISVSVLKKKENNMYLRVEDVGTYCARCFLDYSYTGVTCCSVCNVHASTIIVNRVLISDDDGYHA